MLEPVKGAEGKTSSSLFAPSRTPLDAIAPTQVSIADSSMTDFGRNQTMGDSYTASDDNNTTDDFSSTSTSSTSSSSASRQSSKCPDSPDMLNTSNNDSLTTSYRERQNFLYKLQDHNADLQKQIVSLEIVLRDNGFSNDGKRIVRENDVIRIRDEREEMRAHMEMVSMMGMDPEQPTVLCKYMEFKVAELNEELDAVEAERDRLTDVVRDLTHQGEPNQTSRRSSIQSARDRKRLLEEKMSSAMTSTKSRETELKQANEKLEENLSKAQFQEELLQNRVSELETALVHLGSKVKQNNNGESEELLAQKVQNLQATAESFSEKETALKEQIKALETNLEWNIDESNKREKLLREQVKALQDNLEWNIEESTKREVKLKDQIHELQEEDEESKGDKVSELASRDSDDHDNYDGDSDSDVESDAKNVSFKLTFDSFDDSISQGDLLEGARDYSEPLRTPSSSRRGVPRSNFEQSISELSIKHNKQLEEWKREESRLREEELKSQINALETNLEWNLQQSKDKEEELNKKISALETNLEWNLEEANKRENLLQERIDGLESQKTHEDQTIDSLVNPEDYLEMKLKLDSANKQKEHLESWLTKVVEEASKREKNLQQIINDMEEAPKSGSKEHEESLKAKISELSIQLRQLEDENSRLNNLEKVADAALEKEIHKQDRQVKTITDLRESVKTSTKIHEAQRNEFLAKICDLEDKLAKAEKALASSEQLASLSPEASQDEKVAHFTGRISELERELDSKKRDFESAKDENDTLSSRVEDLRSLEQIIADLEEELESKNRDTMSARDENEGLSNRITELETVIGELEEELESKGRSKSLSNSGSDGKSLLKRIAELEKVLEAEQKDKQYRNEIIADLQTDLASAVRKHEADSSRVFELENELEAYRIEKFDRNKRLSKLQSDIKQIAQKNEEFSDHVMELESELESERREGSVREALLRQIDELRENLESAENDKKYRKEIISSLQNDLQRAIQKNVSDSSRVHDLENELEAYRKEKFDRNKRVSKLQSDMDEIAHKNEGLSETVMDLTSELESERRERSICNKRISTLQSDLELARRDSEISKPTPTADSNDQPEGQAESSEKEKQYLIERVTALQNDLDSNGKFVESMKAYNQSLEKSQEESKVEQTRLYQCIDDLTRQLEEAELKNQSPVPVLEQNLQRRNSQLEIEAKEKDKEKQYLIQRAAALQNKLDTNEEDKLEKARLYECIKQLKTRLEEAELKDESSFYTAESEKCLQRELDIAKKEQDRLNKCIEELTTELEETNLEAYTKQDKLNERIDELTMQLSETKFNEKKETIDSVVIKRLNKRIEILSLELENRDKGKTEEPEEAQKPPEPKLINLVQKVQQNYKPVMQARKNVILDLQNELENREIKTELSELREEFLEAEIKFKAKEDELSTKVQALETELEFSQHEHERLQRVIMVMRNELNMAAVNHEPVVARNLELEKELEGHKLEQERLEKEATDLKEEFQTFNKTFHNEVLELKMKLKSKQSEFEHLNEFKHELEAELEETTEKVRQIENEFEAAARTMDATYGELSVRNNQIEKDLVFYKKENQDLNKFIRKLQNALAQKKDGTVAKKGSEKEITKNRSRDDSGKSNKELSERSAQDELLDSARVNAQLNDDLMGSGVLDTSRDLDDELAESAKTDDELNKLDDDVISSSSKDSRQAERDRLTSEISKTERELEEEKSKQKKMNRRIAELEEEKAQIKEEIKDGKSNLSTDHINAKILEAEAELEALNAHIYELEADLEDLLDDIWDHDKGKEDVSDHEQDLKDGLDQAIQMNRNREQLSNRIVELEKEMEELEDELEETIERSKSERQNLIRKNAELEKRAEKTIEQKNKEQYALAVKNTELENELESMIEKSRKDQQKLAMHYVAVERGLKETLAKAKAEENRLKSQITKLEKELEANQNKANNEEQFMATRLKIIMDSEETEPKQFYKNDAERLLAKVSELKQKFDSSVEENKLLNETIVKLQKKRKLAQENVQRAENEVRDLKEKYTELETKSKKSDAEHETSVLEAEQQMRDLIETANVERKAKEEIQEECKSLKQDFEKLQEENQKLSSSADDREAFVLRITELEEEIKAITTKNVTEQEKTMKRVKNLQKELDMSNEKIKDLLKKIQSQEAVMNENLSSQLQAHEAEIEERNALHDRIFELEKEVQSAIEKSKSEEKRHAELQQRLIDNTMEHQAEKANLDNNIHKLQSELETTTKELETIQEKNESLVTDLQFLKQKNDLNTSGDDLENDLRSTFKENDDIFRKIESYDRQKGTISPKSHERTGTENTSIDEDTLTDRENSFGSSEGSSGREIIGQGEISVVASDSSNHNSIVTTRAGNSGLPSSSVVIANDDAATNEARIEQIEEYLAPLVQKADKVLGQEVPHTIVKGIHDALLQHADEIMGEDFCWEDFEAILEEVCHEYDQDTWFDIQEAFFVAYEEIEIEGMGGDLSEEGSEN